MKAIFGLIFALFFLFVFESSVSAQWNLERDGSNNLNFYPTGASTPILKLSSVYAVIPGGNLGIGAASPAQKLDVAGNIQASIYFDRTDPNYYIQPSNVSRLNSLDTNSITSRDRVTSNLFVDGDNAGYQLDPGGNSRMSYIDADNLYSRGYLTAQYLLDANNNNYQVDPTGRTQLHDVYHDGILQANSDARLKENVEQITGSLEKIGRLRGVSFDWRQDTDIKDLSTKRQIGMIAQEVETVIPEIVSTSPLGYKGIDYSKLTSVLVEAIKAQQKQIEEDRARDDARDKEIELLKQELEKLKNSR